LSLSCTNHIEVYKGIEPNKWNEVYFDSSFAGHLITS